MIWFEMSVSQSVESERMNRPLDNCDSGQKTATKFVIAALLGCLCWVGMAGIFIYFGADRVPNVNLLNNAGQKLTIIWEGQTHALPSGDLLELPPRQNWAFSIRTETGEKWDYHLAPVDRSIGLKDFNLQVEPDGSIHLLRGKAQLPAEKLLPQPKGYPLHPQ
jgi:hypothetical protein